MVKMGVKPSKLLVANRSEIACRVFQTAKEMGLSTVGLKVPGDEEARHLSYCDHAIEVPSYLDADAILSAAQALGGVKFLHPGYGFLSEREEFSKKTEKAGIIFLGPRAETQKLMGGKISSKEFAESIGVPVLPWSLVEKGQDLKASAKKIGFPLLIKASSGGGGKGMRKVASEAELNEALESAGTEALSFFGEGTLFLEKLLENARHIEVQVLGNGKGDGVHLFERDCSLQRKHQKIWEESPAIKLPDATRAKLYESAMKIVKASKYRSVGTCEFLVDPQGNSYFLEMNTRLQVEHPVTESVTGLDLVRCQIEVGESDGASALPSPTLRGHSIEVRLYAEDPAQGFVPSPGPVQKLKFPHGPGIRVDSGIEEGQVITSQFDSMLAKLIVHAPDRKQALKRMEWALKETVILGLGTNQSYLLELCNHPKVMEGDPGITFLETEMTGFRSDPAPLELSLLQGVRSSSSTQVSSAGKASYTSPWLERVTK